MCGIVGIISQESVAAELYDSLVHLQHRGQDAAGIMTYDERFHDCIGQGLVREVFDESSLNRLTGHVGIGHVRYPTAGKTCERPSQPFWCGHPYGIAMAHNGNLINYNELSQRLKKEKRHHLNTEVDSEVLLHLFANGFHRQSVVDNSAHFFDQLCGTVHNIYKQVKGSYSIVSMVIGKGLVGFRDPNGLRPLVIGKRMHDNGKVEYCLASETTMFHGLGFELLDDVAPGEVVYVDESGELFRQQLVNDNFTPCVFEYVYFARPDARLNDISVYRARLRMGQNLATRWLEQYPDVKPDVVIPVPFTSNTSALAFANQLGVRYTEGLYKNPFIGRTFIMGTQGKRKRSVRHKLIPQETEIQNKKVLLLDDSIVRGTTSREIIKMVREYGAKEVYFATTCPPVKFPCFYGIDMPTQEEFIAHNKTIAEIQEYLEVDKLLYQTEQDLHEAVTRKGEHNIDSLCMACLNGEYICGKGEFE